MSDDIDSYQNLCFILGLVIVYYKWAETNKT